MVDTKDKIIQDVAGQLSERTFTGYCYLIFREVENMLFQTNSFPITKTITAAFIESSTDLLSELLEGLFLLQTPILPTYIPPHLTLDDMKQFREVQTNTIRVDPNGTNMISANSSLDIIDIINKHIERDITMANHKNIKFINFIPYLVLRPVLELDPITFTFVYKTSLVYSYRSTQHAFYNPNALYPAHY